MMTEDQYRTLIAKASTDTHDFSADEVRELLYNVCLSEDGLEESFSIAARKLVDLGESVFSLLSAEALKPHENVWGDEECGHISANIVSFFDRSEAKDKTEIRKTALIVYKKYPKQYVICCRVMGNIGEPEDVPALLPFLDKDFHIYILCNVLRAVGKIAAVSQIPDIEKAISDWEKKQPPGGEWRKELQDEVKKCMDNIQERNVQWTPPPKTDEPKAENKEPAEAEKKP
jgi:HEAT repeat protein